MAVSRVQSQSHADSSGSTSLVGTLASATAAGNVLIAVLSAANSGTIAITSVPTGWVALSGPDNAGSALFTNWTYWKVASAGETSWTWTVSATTGSVVVVEEVTGAATSTPVINGGAAASLVSPVSLPVTTTDANSYIISVASLAQAASSAGPTCTAPASTTLDSTGATALALSNNVGITMVHDTTNQASPGPSTPRTFTPSATPNNAQMYTVGISPTVSATTGTTAQVFYPTTAAQDQTISGANVIDKLVTSAPATNSTSTNTYASASTQTVIPYTSTTTASDTTQNNGWAFNNAGVDGLSSTTTDKRVFPAGVWAFQGSLTFNTPALLATATATVVAKVYRVATGGGSRSLLFTATSAVVSSTATGAFAWSASSASQPAYVMAAGEVVEVGFTIASANTLNALSQSTSTIINFTTGSTTFITVPTPGVRTQYALSASSSVSTSTAKQIRVGVNRSPSLVATAAKSVAVAVAKTATFAANASAIKAILLLPKQSSISVTEADIFKIILTPKTGTVTVTAAKYGAISVFRQATITLTAVYAKSITKTISATVTMTPVLNKFLNLSRKLSATTTATASAVIGLPQVVLNRISSGGTTIIKKITNYVFDD
jgi:hypothetical protein